MKPTTKKALIAAGVAILIVAGCSSMSGKKSDAGSTSTTATTATSAPTENKSETPTQTETESDAQAPAPAPAETPAQPTETVSQKNALNKAKSYLNYSAFSYTGLIEQLEYEGYSTEDATYGADNCGADWNAQAARKAKQYLDYSAFSHDGLVGQLEYEGFTPDQAEYGATAVGL